MANVSFFYRVADPEQALGLGSHTEDNLDQSSGETSDGVSISIHLLILCVVGLVHFL